MVFQKSLLALIAGLGLTVSVGATGLACPGTPTTKTPTPAPTAATPAATATPAPLTLLNRSNNGAAVLAAAGVFGGGVNNRFTVATPGKAITVTLGASAPTDFTYQVNDPLGNTVVPTATTGAVQKVAFTFNPVVAGKFNLLVTATAAIPAGVNLTVTVVQ